MSITPPTGSRVTISSATLNYGDGTPPVALGGASTSRLHIFTTAGIYTVTLTVTDSSGQTFTRTVDVQIT